jgi:glycerol uptake facilitator-like aquaporin
VIHGCIRGGKTSAVPYAVAAWIGAAYWFTSSTSFANPAVTIARTLSNTFAGIRPSSAPAFIACQLTGAALAVALIASLWPRPAQEHR